MQPIDIGNRLELMVDDYLIDRLSGSAGLVLHHPQPAEIIPLVSDEHGSPYRYMTVFEDEQGYRMYFGLPRVRHGKAENRPERICMMLSPDGIHWHRPSLNLFEFEGSTDNHIVWMETPGQRWGVGGFSPFKDMNPDCPPEHRYKAIAEAGPVGKKELGGNGLLALVSPDGVHWSMLSNQLIVRPGDELTGFDSQNLAFWDASRNEYRMYRRASYREGPLGVFRDILTYTSPDFLNWQGPTRLSYPGAAPEQMYTNAIAPYFRAPHLFVGFPARYVERTWSEAMADLPERQRREAVIREAGHDPAVMTTLSGGQRTGTALSDTLLMTSRDGVAFHRWGDAFIRPGLRTKNNWFYPDNFQSWGMITTCSAVEEAPDELSFYLSEGGRRSGQSNLCRRYTLRVDGFASLHASHTGGEMITRPLVFKGHDLFVNFSASAAGSVRIEVCDQRGWPLEGFTLDDGVELLGDDLHRRVRWKQDQRLTAWQGRPVRLRFVLNDADVYAFGFEG